LALFFCNYVFDGNIFELEKLKSGFFFRHLGKNSICQKIQKLDFPPKKLDFRRQKLDFSDNFPTIWPLIVPENCNESQNQ